MMKRITILAVLLCGLAGLAFGQTALNQTTLSAAVAGNSVYFGNATPSIDTAVTVGATTGLIASSPSSSSVSSQGGVFASYLYVDHELMGVISFNSTTKIVQVVRGVNNTAVQDHVSGQMVLIGPPGAFQAYDPYGSCTAAGTLFTPWINYVNGNQWLCSSISSTWIPGWGNTSAPAGVSAAVASAAGLITPSGPLFHITGTAAITGFNTATGAMIGFNSTGKGGSNQICVVPDGAFTTTTANNIALASTGVVNKTECWTWDGTNSKFTPAY